MMDDTAFSNRRIYGLYSVLVGGSIPLACLRVRVAILRVFTHLRDFSFCVLLLKATTYCEKSHDVVRKDDTKDDTFFPPLEKSSLKK